MIRLDRYHPNVIKWYSRLLHERFGGVWNITFGSDSIVLSLLGHSGKIRLRTFIGVFDTTNTHPPCGYWEPSSEGFYSALGTSLPAPGLVNDLPLVRRNEKDCIDFDYDIFGLIYWVLGRVEEICHPDLDMHGRVSAKTSHAFIHSYLYRPIVDEWFCILSQLILRIYPSFDLKIHSYSMRLSHDVDRPSRYAFSTSRQLMFRVLGDLKHGYFGSAISAPLVRQTSRSRISGLDRYNTFSWLMQQSEENNTKSCFYFMCGGSSRLDSDYDIDSPSIKKLMLSIAERGHEIGIHPSYHAYNNADQFRKEYSRLRSVCSELNISQKRWGSRMHYLRWSHPMTQRICGEIGIDYDSTLGYADDVGFRCGTCFEFPAYDVLRNEIQSLRIQPLLAMDASLLGRAYLNCSHSSAIDLLLRLKSACRLLGGTFTLLWHNSHLTGKRSLYRQIISS